MRTARFASGAAIVAGGSGGIGSAACRALATGGSAIAFSYFRNEARALSLVKEVEAIGTRALAVKVDLSDNNAVVRFVEDTSATFGGIHTAIYAAGPYINMRHISRIDPAMFRDTLQTDIFGCYHLLHAALPHLRKSKGAIAAIVTPALRRYALKDVLSSAPKAAIEALVKGIAAEEGRFGIRANCVGVGVIEDGMYHQLVATGDFDERYLDAARANVALRRLGSAQDVANAIDFLVSDRAGWITGQTLMVDGGFAI